MSYEVALLIPTNHLPRKSGEDEMTYPREHVESEFEPSSDCHSAVLPTKRFMGLMPDTVVTLYQQTG